MTAYATKDEIILPSSVRLQVQDDPFLQCLSYGRKLPKTI